VGAQSNGGQSAASTRPTSTSAPRLGAGADARQVSRVRDCEARYPRRNGGRSMRPIEPSLVLAESGRGPVSRMIAAFRQRRRPSPTNVESRIDSRVGDSTSRVAAGVGVRTDVARPAGCGVPRTRRKATCTTRVLQKRCRRHSGCVCRARRPRRRETVGLRERAPHARPAFAMPPTFRGRRRTHDWWPRGGSGRRSPETVAAYVVEKSRGLSARCTHVPVASRRVQLEVADAREREFVGVCREQQIVNTRQHGCRRRTSRWKLVQRSSWPSTPTTRVVP